MTLTCRPILPFFFGLGVASLALAHAAHAQALARVSVTPAGAQADNSSIGPAVTPDGRYVAFTTTASNLAANDTNGTSDVYRIDRLTGAVVRISETPAGTPTNHMSSQPSISADGMRIAFSSRATNLVPGDTNERIDVYLRDLATATTTRLSLAPNGGQYTFDASDPAISADGRFVAFALLPYIFVRDLTTGVLESISVVPGEALPEHSIHPSISADGRYVAFASEAPEFTPTSSVRQIYVHDRVLRTTRRVSVAPDGTPGSSESDYPSISADGRFVAYYGKSPNLVPGDTNLREDVFVHDLSTSSTVRISVGVDGAQGDNDSVLPSISADGRFVAFNSYATTFSPPPTIATSHVYLHDRATGRTARIDVGPSGVIGNGAGGEAVISGDGKVVAFTSTSSNLVTGDTNGVHDVFVLERPTLPPAVPTVYCEPKTNSLGCAPRIGASGTPSASMGAPFTITAAQVLNRSSGQLVYGFAPLLTAAPATGLCVSGSLRRLRSQDTGGTPGAPDCSGTLANDFNAWIASGLDGALTPGTLVFAQFLYRDTGDPAGRGATDALRFVIAP